MSDAYVIETPRHTAGIAVRESRGFRFYAADMLFQVLDNRAFRGLRDLQASVERVAAERGSERRAGR